MTDRAKQLEELKDALEMITMVMPARSYPGTGSLWFGHNDGMADATFVDWGLARAVAVILNNATHGLLTIKDP